MPFRRITQITTASILFSFASLSSADDHNAYTYLHHLVSAHDGIGVRTSGSLSEKRTAEFISKTLSDFGYKVEIQTFEVKNKDQTFSSNNVIAELGNRNFPTIILGAHYDSKGEGSYGAIDNGTGTAAMLEVANIIAKNPPKHYNIRFIAFGAEEIGISGSQHYVKQLKPQALSNISGMINFDMIAGGDKMYIHSALTKPYPCGKSEHKYNGDPLLRHAMMNTSKKVLNANRQFVVHAGFKGYPEGETGPWSDHFPFSCAGIPIAFVESTNFSINGLYGFDGLSQTNNPAFWDCFDSSSQGACNREKEKRWGIILHTQFDQLDKIKAIFPKRIKEQLNDTVKLVSTFLLAPEKYLNK